MPPIKVYTQSPINAAKASGVTPQTAASADSDTNKTLPYTPAHTTATPTPTRTHDQDGPPPPQPGAVPRLPEATATATATSTLPPPPRAGAVAGASASPPAPTPAPTAAPHVPGVSAAVPYPPQMGIPPPQTGLNQRGTSTVALSPSAATTAAAAGAGSAWGGSSTQGGNEGYPGYQQNVSAAGGYVAPSPYQSGGGGGGGGGQGMDEEEEGVWGSAVKFAKAAGKRLSEAESEVWRRINGEGSQ